MYNVAQENFNAFSYAVTGSSDMSVGLYRRTGFRFRAGAENFSTVSRRPENRPASYIMGVWGSLSSCAVGVVYISLRFYAKSQG
jgi:hypothetical protein